MTPTADEFKVISLTQLTESKLNPRHHFDPDGLRQLADSIIAKGLIQPLTVRAKGEGYEIVVGARRFRAVKLAELTDVQCVVRTLTDLDVLEIMVIENNQREDVHPLEEAEGYRALMKQGKYDVAALAARVGRSINYVYDRVKLLELTKDAQDLFWDGLITAGHAILLARLSPADQKRVIGTEDHEYRDGGLLMSELTLFTPEQEDDDKINPSPVKAVSVRELQAWIDEHVRFDRTSVEPLLFPQTAEVLKEAEQDALKIISITRNFSVDPEAKDEKDRIYGPHSWTRADGRHGSKKCQTAVLGAVVVGPGRGETFLVCTDKKGCTVHYAAQIKEREKRDKAAASGAAVKENAVDRHNRQVQENYRQQEEQRQADHQRWDKALPIILEAVAGAVKKAPTRNGSLLWKIILEAVEPRNPGKGTTLVPLGKTADDLIRRAAYLLLYSEAVDYNAVYAFPKLGKALGIDVAKILKTVAPEPPALKDCTVCGTKNIDPTKHVCSPAALKKAKKSKTAKAPRRARKRRHDPAHPARRARGPQSGGHRRPGCQADPAAPPQAV